jgi:hypothetical protein
MSVSLQVIVSDPTPDAMAYARALERRGATIATVEEAMRSRSPDGQPIPYVLAEPVPYVITRPHDGSLYRRLACCLDAEALHPANIGRMVTGAPYEVPPICQAVDEWLDSLEYEGEDLHDIHVVGHGLGAVIAAYLARRGVKAVVHTRTEWCVESLHLPTINASRIELPGRRVLQMPLNPPEFSRRLIDLVVERAAAIGNEMEGESE